jgi:predicted nucleic acid-binding protein
MIVIADSSPLNYLVLIGQADLLAKLYGHVVIPPAVHNELQREGTPVVVRQFFAQPPPWLTVHKATITVDASLERLGAGEREAIALAEALHADAILIDERDGRRLAERRNFDRHWYPSNPRYRGRGRDDRFPYSPGRIAKDYLPSFHASCEPFSGT